MFRYEKFMKALILQHEASTPPGSTTEWLEKRKISYHILDVANCSFFPSVDDYDFLFICGGSMNVDEEHKFPWLKNEKSLIQEALQKKKKTVGLCLGGQLISEALGGHVQKQPQYEVGWHFVEFSNHEKLMVFQWHGYGFDLPPGAELLATNSNCKYQAFTFGKHVLGFQFHPETTLEWALQCSESPRLPKTGFVQTKDEIQRDMKYQARLQEWYFEQLDALAKN